MKIIILAAGKGTRMGFLTDILPKPLLEYKGKTLIEHKLESLPKNTTEVILVVGYLGDKIREYFGESYSGIPIRYVEQQEMKGTAHALWQCKDFLDGQFMVLMGDDIYSASDLENMSHEKDWAILTYPDLPTTKAAKMVKDGNENFKGIHEDFTGTSIHTLIYTGVCVLTPEIFTKNMFELSSGEFGLPQSFAQFVDTKDIKVLETHDWKRITSAEDLI